MGVWLPNFSSGAVGVVGFEGPSPNFIADIVGWFLGSVLDWERFCIGACRGRGFVVAWCVGSEGLWVGLVFLVGSKKLSFVTNVLDIK